MKGVERREIRKNWDIFLILCRRIFYCSSLCSEAQNFFSANFSSAGKTWALKCQHFTIQEPAVLICKLFISFHDKKSRRFVSYRNEDSNKFKAESLGNFFRRWQQTADKIKIKRKKRAKLGTWFIWRGNVAVLAVQIIWLLIFCSPLCLQSIHRTKPYAEIYQKTFIYFSLDVRRTWMETINFAYLSLLWWFTLRD